jgi:hypothetical protein
MALIFEIFKFCQKIWNLWGWAHLFKSTCKKGQIQDNAAFLGVYFSLGGSGGPVRTELFGLGEFQVLKPSHHGYGGPAGCPWA